MVKHTQTIRQQQPTNCLSMFDHIVGLSLKGLNRKGNGISEWVKFLAHVLDLFIAESYCRKKTFNPFFADLLPFRYKSCKNF